jgi:hypothetical protein
MIRRALILGWLGTGAILAEQVPPPTRVMPVPDAQGAGNPGIVTSSSKQFKISGGTTNERGMVSNLAEEAKNELLRLTKEKEEWKIPIHIVLHGKKGDPAPARTFALAIFITDVGYEIRADLHLSQGIPKNLFKSHVTSALIDERALRTREKGESETPLQVPPWLVLGLQEATAWRLNQSDRRLYEALYKMGGFYKIDELFAVNDLTTEQMDTASRAAFQVSAGALVMALLQQPQGKVAFRSFLTEVASFEGEMPALLRKHFPELNLSETSLAKWWALQLANIGGKNLLTDVLNVPQTEAALTEALKLHFKTPEGILEPKDLSAWPDVAKLPAPERAPTVTPAQEALVRLSLRCFPSYRPILSDYQTALSHIATGTTKDTAAQLTKLQEHRNTMSAKAARARDYLIWFEMTRAQEISGDFDAYMRLTEKLKAPVYRREDGISTYLDQMDKIFDRGAPPPSPNSFPRESASPLLPELPR